MQDLRTELRRQSKITGEDNVLTLANMGNLLKFENPVAKKCRFLLFIKCKTYLLS